MCGQIAVVAKLSSQNADIPTNKKKVRREEVFWLETDILFCRLVLITCDNDVDGINFASRCATNETIGILITNIVDTYSEMPISVFCINHPTLKIRGKFG